MQHSFFKFVSKLSVASFEQHAHVADGFLIFCRRAETLDARTETAFDVIFETRARRFAVDFNIASAQLKSAIDQIDRSARHRGRQKWSEVKCAVILNATSDNAFWKWFVDGELQMRIRLIV